MIPIDLRLSAKSDYNWLGVSCGWRDEGLDPTVNCLHGHSIIFNVAKWTRREEVIGYDEEEKGEEDEVVNPLFPGLCPSLSCSLWTEFFVEAIAHAVGTRKSVMVWKSKRPPTQLCNCQLVRLVELHRKLGKYITTIILPLGIKLCLLPIHHHLCNIVLHPSLY